MMNRLQSTGSVVVVACALLACFGMLVPASMLSAQQGAATYPAPPPPPPPPAARPAPQPRPSPAPAPRRRTQSNVWLEVPLFLDVNSDVVRPGFGVAFRSGLRVKDWLVPGVEVGASWNPIDLSNEPSIMPPTNIKDPLWRIYVNLGLQFQYETEKITPYASVAMDFNFWHFLEESVACGIWYCSSYSRFRFTPGLTARVGSTIHLNPTVGLDLGLRIGWTGEGDFFQSRETWLAPYVGMSF